MAKRPNLTDLTSLTNSSGVNAINSNWDAIESAFDNTLSRDGSTPNAMNADLDLNGNALLNVGTIDADNLTLDGQVITDVSAVPEWRGSWLTATAYAKRDMVKTGGNVYICLVAHTSGTFSTDLTNLNWELMVSKGDSGEGAGDLVSTNNLSDLDDVPTARSNLGLGTMATLASGTGDSQFRTNLQNDGRFQPLDSDLTTIAGLVDPNADRILFWDDSAGAYAYLTPGDNLTITGTTLSASTGRTLLASKTASSSATLDFTEFNNSTYRRYEFDIEFVLPATDNTDLWMRTSTNGGSSYDSGASDYSYLVHGGTAGGVSIGPGGSETTAQVIICATVGNAANEFGVNADVSLIGAANSSAYTIVRGDVTWTNSASATVFNNVTGMRKSAADVDAVRFLFSSGNISSGTIRMYGVV